MLIVLVIRSFLVQPYRVPSGSLEPTIRPGDFILVNQFAYGLHLPLLNKKIVEIGEPERGDITLFQFPKNPAIVYIKRVVGLPGDSIEYRHKQLYINGEPAVQSFNEGQSDFLSKETRKDPKEKLIVKTENLSGITHQILIDQNKPESENFYFVVPEGHYFMMGDNRDGSYDSRYWGFVPEENLIGKALFVWFSWDSKNYTVAWRRIGQWLR